MLGSSQRRFAQRAAVWPNDIGVYFEDVGGVVLEAVLPLLDARARIPVCGLIG